MPSRKGVPRLWMGLRAPRILWSGDIFDVISRGKGDRWWFCASNRCTPCTWPQRSVGSQSAHICRFLTAYCRTRHLYMFNWPPQNSDSSIRQRDVEKCDYVLSSFGCATFLCAKWRLVNKWSCGELNPGPMTVPSVFYVRSLLAVMAICLPPPVSQTTGGGHSRRKSPRIVLRCSGPGKSS